MKSKGEKKEARAIGFLMPIQLIYRKNIPKSICFFLKLPVELFTS